jgi:hypothetical protein
MFWVAGMARVKLHEADVPRAPESEEFFNVEQGP